MLLNTTCRLATAAHRLIPGLLHIARNGFDPQPYSWFNAEHVKMDNINDVDMGQVLDIVHHTCAQYDLPDLAALAVNKQTGRPGERYVLSGSWEAELEKIRAFNWASVGRLDVTVNLRMN